MAPSSPQSILFRIAIGLYVVCIFSLVASYFAVSTMDVAASMYLQAPSTLKAGLPNAVRGIVMDAPTGRLYVDARTEFTVDGTPIGEGRTASHGHLHTQLTPPKALVGKKTLAVSIEHPGIEAFDLSVGIKIDDANAPFVWPKATTRLGEEKNSGDSPWEGDSKVLIIPPEGELPRGLPTLAYFLLLDAKTEAPVRGSIFIDKIEGMLASKLPAEVTTDELGLARVPLTATTSLLFTLTARAPATEGVPERSGTGKVRLRSVASQFSLAPSQLMAVPGQPLQAYVATLHRSGGLLSDLYDGERWVQADAFGIGPDGAGVRAMVPPGVVGPLMRLQVYQDLFDASAAWDSRWLVVAPDASPTACIDALRVVLDLHAVHSKRYAKWAAASRSSAALKDAFQGGRCDHWLEASLLAVPQRFVPAPLLANTQKLDREALDTWRQGTQRSLMFATTGVLLVGFALVLLLVLQGMGRRQLHATTIREVELETATDDELARPLPMIDVDRWVFLVQTAIIVLTIFTFGASLLMLLTWM